MLSGGLIPPSGAGAAASGSGLNVLDLGHTESHDSATPFIVSQFEINPLNFGSAPTITFRVVAANGNGSVTTHVQLFNLTDGEEISNLTFNGSTSPALQSVAVVIGSGAGQMDPVSKIYEVRIFVDAPSIGSDTVELGSVDLRIS